MTLANDQSYNNEIIVLQSWMLVAFLYIMIDMRKLISRSSIYWTKVCRNHGINYRISDSKQWCRLSFETSFNFLTERILGSIVCNFSWFMWMLQLFDLENINAIHKFMKHVLAIVVQCKAENVRCLNNLNVIQYYSTKESNV